MLSEKIFRGFRALAALVLAASALGATVSFRGELAGGSADEPLSLVTADGERIDLELDAGLDRTMRDPQLAERTWEVRGRRRDDGRLAVEKIFTVKEGELFRVTYYCEICHITTHEPGRCMCCQEDTELREIPGE